MPQAYSPEARDKAWSTPLDQLDVSRGDLFQNDEIWPYFERLRKEAPVHYCAQSNYGGYWSVTRYRDIMQVDTSHQIFSSAEGINIPTREPNMPKPGFIASDPPEHDEQRKVVSPIVAPMNLARLEGTIRERVCTILDGLPIGETFNWVEHVSIALTTQMLATLFDFPWEDRKLLTYWSDVGTANIFDPDSPIKSNEQRLAELMKALEYFMRLFNERKAQPPKADLVSMLAHSPATNQMKPLEFLGQIMLLIVGGNDTTRNSISGGLTFLNQFPDQYARLKADPGLIPNMVSEIIRYQTPLAHMRRTALVDTELQGQKIKAGDKVIMWYLSGNRDEDVIPRANDFLIDRPNVRQHLSFGFGIHRCVGNRLAEMQLRIMWEEILKRFTHVEVVGKPVRTNSCFVHGFTEVPVRIAPSAVITRH